MPRTPKAYPDVVLPDGRVVTPRARLAQELGIHERTLKRANAETVYIGARAYVARDSAIMDIAGNLRRRNEPAKRRASGGRS